MARPEYHKVHAYLTDMPVEMAFLDSFSLFQYDIPPGSNRTNQCNGLCIYWGSIKLRSSVGPWKHSMHCATFQAKIEDPRMQNAVGLNQAKKLGLWNIRTLWHALAYGLRNACIKINDHVLFWERIRESAPLQGKPVNAPREMHNGKLVMGLGRYVKFHMIEQARAMGQNMIRWGFYDKHSKINHSKIKADDLKPLLYHALSNLAPWMQFYNTLPTQCALLELELSTFVKHPEWLTFVIIEHHPKESALEKIGQWPLSRASGRPNTETDCPTMERFNTQHQHDTLPMPLDQWRVRVWPTWYSLSIGQNPELEASRGYV